MEHKRNLHVFRTKRTQKREDLVLVGCIIDGCGHDLGVFMKKNPSQHFINRIERIIVRAKQATNPKTKNKIARVMMKIIRLRKKGLILD